MFADNESPANLIDKKIGRYKIIRLLGSGGMGEVYLAEDVRLHRKVALKILPKHFAADASRLSRFEREARAASALNHPNILTVHEFGAENNLHFLATEFVEGETLRERIGAGEMSVADTLDIAGQIAFALSAAHFAKIVHRDIKPENIMIRAGCKFIALLPDLVGGRQTNRLPFKSRQTFCRREEILFRNGN